MKIYECMSEALAAEGCGLIFGLMGDGNINFMAAVAAKGAVPTYSVRHEAAAVAMADGYWRATGHVGAATITCGPGLTQIGTSLMAAARNRSAVVIIAGDTPARDASRLQDFDQRRFIEAAGGRFLPISSAETAAEDIRDAFYTALNESCPVVLNAPIDVQEKEYPWDWAYGPSAGLLSLSPRQVLTTRSEDLLPLAEALIRAERPVIIAGRGAVEADARKEIEALAERIGALLATSLLAKGFFAGHDYDVQIAGAFSSAPTEKLLANADFVLGIGAELGYYTTEGGFLFPGAEVARIDVLPHAPGPDVLPGLYVRGDARETVRVLTAMLDERGHRAVGFRTAATRQVLAEPPPPTEPALGGLDPRRLMRELSAALPENCLVVCGVGHFWSFPAMYLTLPSHGRLYFSHQFGAIGQTLPVAIGVRTGNPTRPMLVIEGDGSLMMHIQEIETAARYGLPMTLLVFNDFGLGAEAHKLRAKGYDPAIARFGSPDFVGIARAMGGDGTVLEAESAIGDALRLAGTKKGPFIIDARISPEALSDPYRRIHFGLENVAPLLQRSPSY